MIYAQILNGIVLNIIVLDDNSLIPIFSEGFDNFVLIDQLIPRPGINWSYDGKNFSPAPPDPIVIPNEGSVIDPLSVDTLTRNLLSPSSGDQIFNTDTNTIQYFDGSKWNDL